MRRRMIMIVILWFTCFNLILLQMPAQSENTFDAGVKQYIQANRNRQINQKLERDDLLIAYEIFKNLVPDSDNRALVMSYVVFLRLQSCPQSAQIPRTFFQPEAIDKFVKKEYPDQFPTIEKMNNIFSSKDITREDKRLLLENLKSVAEKCKQRAKEFFDEAVQYRWKYEYETAIDKLRQSQELWDLPETGGLIEEYNGLLEKSIKIRADYDAQIKWKNFQEAIDLLNDAKGILSDDELKSMENNARTLRDIYLKDKAEKLYSEAEAFYEKRDLQSARDKCAESLKINRTEKAEMLMKEISKRLKKFAFFINLGSTGAIKPGDMNYSGGNRFNDGVISDRNTIVNRGVNMPASFGGGFIYLFSRSNGIMFSVSSIKHSWKFDTDYNFACAFSNGVNRSFQAAMTDDAESSLTPINIDFVVVSPLFKDLNIFLQVGPTIYFANVNFNARIGMGGIWPFTDQNAVYDECFPIRYSIKESGFGGIGGNIGGGLEYRLPPVGIFLGFEYYLFPYKKYEWEMIDQGYRGLKWDLTLGSPSVLYPTEYKMKINFSTFKVNVGVRYYL